MGYAATSDLEARLKPYHLLLADDGSFDANSAQMHLDSAQAEVDACVGVRYVAPVSDGAACLPMLKNWVLTLAEELAHNYNVSSGETPDNVKTRAAGVRSGMTALRKGELYLSGAVERQSSAGGVSEIFGEDPRMTREKLRGW